MIFFLFLFVGQKAGECYSTSSDTRSDVNKRLELLEKQIPLKIQTLQKENEFLRKEIQVLHQKTNIYFEYCKLLPDNIWDPCVCRDDERLLPNYYCGCQNLQPKRDCLEYYQYGIKINGIYKVHQNILKIIQVFCDQTTDGGGWTIFKRRTDRSVNLFRDWQHYKQGFGNLQNEFWLGNEE